jgi:hypothetical protein
LSSSKEGLIRMEPLDGEQLPSDFLRLELMEVEIEIGF